jgi:cell division protein FtsZ
MSETGMAMMGSGAASGAERAREAAEAAVSSPLLEDINLAGAHGILVNVTAGMDLSIGEFEIVGNTVKKFASDDATVVVGTVIDPEMSNQVRVTVVATGLGRPSARQTVQVPQAQMRVVANRGRGPLSGPDYAALDKPTVQRQRAVGDGIRGEPGGEELLDIPAFLRRQAD